MAAVVAEYWKGVSGDALNRRIPFLVKDATSDIDARDATIAYIATNYATGWDGLPFKDVTIDDDLAYHLGIFICTGHFSLDKPEPPETNDIEVTFDFATETQRIYERLPGTTTTVYPSGDDIQGRINQPDPEGPTEGADVLVPAASFQLTWYAPVASITSAYRKTLLETVACVNNATFYLHAAGEVMFAGAAGRRRSIDDWELTFRFLVKQNRTGVTIGSGAHQITGIAIQGWQVLHAQYAQEENAQNRPSQFPEKAFVDTVYPSADFSVLGIGT